MKKIYVSLPISGRKLDDISASIVKMKKIAEILLGDECEVLSLSKFSDLSSTNIIANCSMSISDIAEDIKVLAEADFFVGLLYYGPVDSDVKNIEESVARSFRIPTIEIHNIYLVCPDLEAIDHQMEQNRHYSNACNCSGC